MAELIQTVTQETDRTVMIITKALTKTTNCTLSLCLVVA